MTITPLSTLPLLPDGSELEAVEIRLTKLDQPKPFGQGTIQSAYAESADGSKASVRFVDFDTLGQDWVGPWMRLIASTNGRGDLTGLSVDSYNGKKRLNIKGVDRNGNPRVTVEWLPGVPAAQPAPARQAQPPARQAGPPAHRDDIHYDNHAQQPARPAMSPPPRQGPPPQAVRQAPPPVQPAQPSRPPVPAGPHGATVGMAVKEAFSALCRSVTPEGLALELRNPTFWQDVHAAASELLHISKALESGDIAPSIVNAPAPDFQAMETDAQNEPWEAA